jgi:hypothetical protein
MSDTALLEKPPAQQDGGDSQEPPNKYLYPEFAGYAGERYLDTLIQQILPYALWRTWHYAVDYQAPGNVCYVGTARLASRVKPGVRKIEIDFQELEARGLMRKYAARLPVLQEDGSFKGEAVTVKDFTALYALAHEYHLWTHSDEYIPAARDQIDPILADPRLLAKVLRFDNYRRLIECRKPGRKAIVQPVHLYYQCVRPEDEVGWEDRPEQPATPRQCAPAPGTSDQNANLFSNASDKTAAAYRESNNEEDSSEKVSISSGFEDVVGTAIGNPTTDQAVETDGETEEIQTKSKPKQPNSPTQEEMGRAGRAKDATAYNIEELKRDPYAMAAALLEMRERGELGGEPQPAPTSRSQKPKKNQRPRRMPPQALINTIGMYAQQLGDNQKFVQSDITRATKIYLASTQIFSGFQNGWFREQLEAAFAATLHARSVKKRMPYFFSTLENQLEFSVEELAFIRSDEPLFADSDIGDFVRDLQRQHRKSGSTLDYVEWIRQTWLAPVPAARV